MFIAYLSKAGEIKKFMARWVWLCDYSTPFKTLYHGCDKKKDG
jgi:hypothetical protein